MPSTINSAKGSKIPLPRFVGHLLGRMSQFRTAATAQRAPIAGLEEEEEMELQAEDEEEEYSYEECDEEEEDDDEEVDEKMTKSDGFLMVGGWKGKEGNDEGKLRGKEEQEWKNSRQNMSPNSLESSGDGGLNLLEEKCRKLIAVPVHELEAEQSLALRRGNSAFWTPCPAQAFRLCRLLQDGDELPTSGKALVPVELLLEENMETGKWDSGDGKDTSLERKMVPWESLQRPSFSHLCLDMSQLSELNEPSVLECIRRRYALRLIHTYSGLFCVVVNPWQPLAGLYSAQMRAFYARGGGGGGDGGADMPPHVYSIAQSAFDGICSPTAASQSILITGESGAGKTENTKRIIEYLIDVSSSRARPHQAGQPDEAGGIDRALVAAGTALEAFGNAQTVHNDNSSRLGKFIRVHFEPGRGRLLSARIDCFLLEKSRVVSQNPGDRNFHIFYRLLADPNFLASAKAERILDGLFGGFPPRADAFRFLNQGQRGESVHAKFVDDLAGGRDTETALDQLGFTPSEKGWLRELMVACALVGQIRFGERTGLDMSFVEEPALEMEAVAQLLALRQPGRLTDALTQPSIRVGDALIRRSQPLRKTVASAQALAKCLYERVFGWLLAKCNRAIGGNNSDEKKNGGSTGKNDNDGSTFVGVLDMAGFEIMARNSFEQLCINYTNERLQQFFNEFMFVREQQEYAREGIRWEQQCYGSDLQPTIDLIEKPLGILSLLQEECIVPNGSEQSLLEKMLRRLGQSAPSVFARAKQSSRTPNNGGHFTVAHYAGPVTYNVDGWLEKNRDAVDASLLEVLANSEHPLLVQLFPTPPSASNASAAATNGSPKPRKGPAMAQASISFVYREQLAQLLDTLGRTRAHFVRCIVPNHGRVPFQLDGKLTMDQLRCNGVLEGIRICRRGYPNRLPFAQFLARYRLLQHNIGQAEEEEEPREAVQRLCSALGLGPDRFQVGRTKLFCRVGLVSELEARRRRRLEQLLTGLQAQIRWWRAQLEVKRRREEWHSLVTVQRAIRRQVQLKSWPWFRLWLKVRQLIPLAAQRRRLAELEEENRQLGKKLAQWQAQAEKSQRELEDSRDRLERVEQQRTEDRRQAEELRAELRRNEELLERMERKWDEQHAKVMRLNGTLGEQARALERLEEERNGLSKELGQLRERHRTEQLERESAEAALDAAQEESVKLRANADEMLAEMSRQRTLMNRKEAELDEHRERGREQQEELADLNRALAEANDRLGELQPLVHTERSGRRKAEALAEELGQELNRLGEELDRTGAKRDAMKEQLRAREVQTRKLERKLEEKQAEMEDCLAELRRAHKRSQTELQEQLDEWRRKSLRLETENAQLRCRLEAQSSALEMANTTGHGGRQAGGGGGGGGRFGSCQTLLIDREQRDSSVDSDCGGTGPYGIHRSLTRPHATTTTSAMHYPGSLHRRRRHGLAEFEPSSATIGLGLHRSASGTASSVGNLSSAHSSSTSSSRRRAAANQQMITSLTATVDSGLLTRSPSSTSTVSGGCTGGPQYLSMAQRVDAAERRMLEKEREAHSQRQDAQMARRELEVYKQSLQESERARDSLGKQIRQLNSELEQMGRALKAEEERTQKAEFETRKQATECAALKQRLEEQREESDAGLMAERKRNADKLDQLAHEYETRLRQLGNSQRSQEQLLERLTDAESQLDKARAQLAHMERLQRTQSAIGETWESQYRTAQQELEGIRDENAALKSRIRRQHKQIELLTQQSELSERVNELESRVGQVQDRFGGGGGGGEKSMMAMGNGSGSGGQQKCMLAEEEEEAEDDDDDDDEEGEEEVDVQVQVFTFNCNC